MTGSSAASTRWPSVWPSGISRTPAEIQLAAMACRNAGSAASSDDAVAGAGDADRDRIGHRPVPCRRQQVERLARPGRAGRREEGARPARWFRDAAPSRARRRRRVRRPRASAASSLDRGAMRVHEQHRVAKARAVAHHQRQPVGERRGIAGCRPPPPPIRCRSNRRTRRPDRTATARPSGGRGAAASFRDAPASGCSGMTRSDRLRSPFPRSGMILFLSHGRGDHDGDDGARAHDRMRMSVRHRRLRIERRLDRGHRARRARAASPPARDRAGCGCDARRSARRCGDCRDARRAARIRAASDAAISASGSGMPVTSTTEPSSSTRPSPSRSVTGLSKSSRKLRALLAGQHDAPARAVVGVERDAVDGGRGVPGAGGGDGGDAVHGLHSSPVVPAERSESRDRIITQPAGFTGSPLSQGTTGTSSKQKIPLRHRQHVGRLAGEQFAVRPHLVGFGIDVDASASRRCGSCSSWRCRRGCSRTATSSFWMPSFLPSPPRTAAFDANTTDDAVSARAEGAEHRPVMHRLRRRDRGIGIAHRRGHDRCRP